MKIDARAHWKGAWGNTPYRVSFIIDLGNKRIKVFSLHVSFDQNELFVHFEGLGDGQYVNLNTGKNSAAPDHISFHKSGRRHMRLKKCRDTIFEVESRPLFCKALEPLIFHAFCDISLLPEVDKDEVAKNNERARCYTVCNSWATSSGQISIILVAVHEALGLAEVNGICEYFGARLVGRIEIKNGYVICYLLTNSVLALPRVPFPVLQAFVYL